MKSHSLRSLPFFALPLLFLFPFQRLFAQPCSAVTFSLQAVNPGPTNCCYRLVAQNTTDNCFQQMNLSLSAGVFTSFAPLAGFQAQQVSANEYNVRPSVGFLKFGTNNIATFCVAGPQNQPLTILYDNLCQLIGCSATLTLNGCAAKNCIKGLKYVDIGCRQEPFNGQPALANWLITLCDVDGNFLDSTRTDASGKYSFCNLLPGDYLVKEPATAGWNFSIPASGETPVTLVGLTDTVTANFGNCPSTCACNQIYLHLDQAVTNTNDTVTYYLSVLSETSFCFTYVNIQVDSGILMNGTTLLPGWKSTLVTGNLLQLNPPDVALPSGGYIPIALRVRGVDKHKITLTTVFNNGNGDVECKTVQVFFPIPPPIFKSCCPAGSVPGPELVANGNFTAGNTGFTTDYFPLPFCNPRRETVADNANPTTVPNLCGGWNCLDHTSGTPAGKMFVADGAQIPGLAAWREQFTLAANTQYAFCAWVNNLNVPALDRPDPIIEVWLVPNSGPATMLASITPNEAQDYWKQIAATWTAPASPANPYLLEFRTAQTSFEGNNFALDDISFRACSAILPPCTVTVTTSVSQAACGIVSWTANPSGSGPFSYQWCNGQNTQNIVTQQVPCQPTTCTVTVTCADGTTATASATVTVQDNVPPTAVCQPGVGVVLDPATCQYLVSPQFVDGGSSDNCQIASMSVSPAVLTGCQLHTVTLTVTDGCGNTATCTMGIQTTEGVPPTITCPPDKTLDCADPLNFGQATATDNCDPAPAITFVSHVAILGCKSIYTVLWTATDFCGNTATCVQTVTVDDLKPPTLSCPFNVSVLGAVNAQGLCKATVTGIGATVTDNCPNWTLGYTISPPAPGGSATDASGSMFMQGLSTVTYTVTDCGGFTKTCSFTVTVVCPPNGSKKCGWTVGTCYANGGGAEVGAIFDTRLNTSAATPGQDWAVVGTPPAPSVVPPMWYAGQMGQVFGIATDNVDKIFLAATDVYHLDAGLGSGSGPGGSAGVYKTDCNAPYSTTNIVSSLNSPTLFPVTGTQLPSTGTGGAAGNGIGNICYDQAHNQLFATNLEDGRIYRMDVNGNLLSALDPFQLNNGVNGIERDEEQLWGVGVFQNRLYFARRESGTNPKQVWSVALQASGEFGAPATLSGGNLYVSALPTLDINNGPGTETKYTDIAFSQTGSRMLLAERGAPHSAGVWEYQLVSGSWVPSANLFHVGYPTIGKNSAGGVDYGYREAGGNPTAQCDGMVWATGNCIDINGVPGLSCDVYGIEGIAPAGNAHPANSGTDIFIDFDGNYVGQQKNEIGDVEAFRCGCKAEGSHCDSISVTSMPFNNPDVQDTCCFKLTYNVQAANSFAAIQLCAQSGVSISSISVLGGCQLQGFTATQVTVVPPGGFPNTFPVGTKDFLKFCLSNYQITSTQEVIVKYYDAHGEIVCRDTLHYQCTQKPKCVKITATAGCAQPGTSGIYTMNFCVMSNPLIGWTVDKITLNPPPGVTFSPNMFTGLNIPPGGMVCNLTTSISGPNAVDLATICFTATAHALNAQPPINCCTDTVMKACVTLPECVCNHVRVDTMHVANSSDGRCCWKLSLTNGYSPNFFTGVQLNILTPGVVFGSIAGSFSWNLNYNPPQQATFMPIPGPFMGIGTSALPTFCLSGITLPSQVPQKVEVVWLGPNGNIVCRDTLLFDCQPPDETDCAALVNPLIKCDPATGGYIFQFQVYNNTGTAGPPFNINQITLTQVPAIPNHIAPTVFNIPPLPYLSTSGVLTANLFSLNPGDVLCFYLTVHEVDANGNELQCCTHTKLYCFTMPPCPQDCACGPFDFLYGVGHGPLLPKHCGDTLTVPSNPNLPIQFNSSFQCVGLNCPPATVTWTLMGPAGFTQIGPFTVPATPGFSTGITNATFTIPGTYMLTMLGHCGQKECPCKLTFIVPKKDSCCTTAAQFMQNIQNSVTVTVDPANCKVKLSIGQLPPCDDIKNINWGDGNFTPGPLVAGGMAMHNYAGSGTYIVSFLAEEYDYSVMPPKLCFEKLVRDTIKLNCQSSCCTTAAQFMQNIQNAVSFSVDPANCKIKLNIGQLPPCDDIRDINWGDGNFDAGPFVSGGMSMHTYAGSGTYIVSFLAEEYDYSVTPPKLCFEKLVRDTFKLDCPHPDTCCHDSTTFNNLVAQGFTVALLNCKAIVTAPQFDTCYFFGTPPSLDGANVPQVITDPSGMWMYNFTQSGTHQVCVTVFDACQSKKMCTSFAVHCDSCDCLPFSGTQFYNSSWQPGFKNVKCGDNVVLPCLKTGPPPQPLFFFHGNLNCNAKNCLGPSVNWAIVQNGVPVASGTTSLNPLPNMTSGHFDIGLNPALFTPGTSYMLTVSGLCGTKVCVCKITFRFEACPCACKDLWAQVGQGFSASGGHFSCKRTLKPKALCPGDMVTWSAVGPGFSMNFGPTSGNATQMIVFPGPGIYTVCMFVMRADAAGQICKREYCRKIYVKCHVNPNDPADPTIAVCPGGNLLQNGDFLTAKGGDLGQGTASVGNWELFPNTGDGQVFVEDSSGASDDGHLVLIGGKDNFAGVFQRLDPAPLGDTAFIGLEVVNLLGMDLPAGTALEFRGQKDTLPGSPSKALARLTLDSSMTGWTDIALTIPVHLDPTMPFFVVCLQNENAAVRSVVGIDNLEFCAREKVGTFAPGQWGNIRIVPNPNPGQFTVVLPGPAPANLFLKISDLAGRMVFEKQAENGSQRQTIRAEKLPPGLYFLQVVSEGKLLAVEKFVKE